MPFLALQTERSGSRRSWQAAFPKAPVSCGCPCHCAARAVCAHALKVLSLPSPPAHSLRGDRAGVCSQPRELVEGTLQFDDSTMGRVAAHWACESTADEGGGPAGPYEQVDAVKGVVVYEPDTQRACSCVGGVGVWAVYVCVCVQNIFGWGQLQQGMRWEA